MTTAADADRLLKKNAASALAQDAFAGARAAEMGAPSWHFYHGVEAAAQHVLVPELVAVREGTAWLDAQHPAFRKGFLEGSAALSATPAGEPPHRVRLPEPPHDA